MPTPTTYTYAISTDTINGAVDLNRLTQDIQQSSIVTALDSLSTAGDTLSVKFKDALSTADKTTLDNDADPPTTPSLIWDHTGVALEDVTTVSLSHKLTGDDRIRVAMEKSDASAFDAYSHNWADPTTWYSSSVRIVDEVATDSGDHITYNLSKTNIIDVYHGKLTGEDDLLDASSNSYRVTVKIDDVVKTEQDPHTGTGGDFTVDYTNGDVIMTSALVGTEVIKVTFHYATDSKFKIIPTAGEKIIIEVAEVQFSDDVIITDTVFFQTFGYVDVFAPQLLIANGGPYPSLTKIPIRTFKYKTMRDYQNAAFKAYPVCPAMGGVDWRGMPRSVIVFDWDYQRGMTLYSSYGMESRLYLEHDAPFGGSWATATLYCGVDTE